MITEYGDNLHVLFVPKIKDDWKAFAAWYSSNKNLPYASKSLVYTLDDTHFQIFQWAKRLEMPVNGIPNQKDELLNIFASLYQTVNKFNKPVLFVPSLHMILKPLSKEVLNILNDQTSKFIWDQEGIGFCNLNKDQIVELSKGLLDKWEKVKLTDEAKETENLKSLVSYKKGCGKWIDSRKGCPFASAGGLISQDMTVNERKIIELWRKMVPLYSFIS